MIGSEHTSFKVQIMRRFLGKSDHKRAIGCSYCFRIIPFQIVSRLEGIWSGAPRDVKNS
jgi:hypothetical protein